MSDIVLFSNSDSLLANFEKILPNEQHNIFFTTSVDECMKKLYSQNIDGVIIDYSADVDLASLARKIKIVGKKRLPFVLLYAPSDYENELLFRYIDGFITKGCSKSQVNALIHSALKIEKNIKHNKIIFKNS